MDQVILVKRERQVLYDKKWKKFLRRARIFRYLPFVDFALGAGSLAVGRVSPESDFDVIVGVKSGRIFTARFFASAAFGIFGWRRSRLDHRTAAADKICLNHFTTPAAYALKPPHTDSWRELYLNLVPVWGDPRKISEFFEVNTDWISSTNPPSVATGGGRWGEDLRFSPKPPSPLKKSLEYILAGKIGDMLERAVKFLQIKKIERSLKKDHTGYKPRLTYSDLELEFHPDRRKFES